MEKNQYCENYKTSLKEIRRASIIEKTLYIVDYENTCVKLVILAKTAQRFNILSITISTALFFAEIKESMPKFI